MRYAAECVHCGLGHLQNEEESKKYNRRTEQWSLS